MPDPPELLVPFDGTVTAERLLRHACRVAGADDARLTVLCVVALPADAPPDAVVPELEAGVMRALVRAQQVCREEGAVAVFEYTHARNLADAIVEDAQRSGATLICLNLDEHAPGETALMSRTVQSVLQSAPCPVLLNDPTTPLPPVAPSA